jgi:hypothetical protein
LISTVSFTGSFMRRLSKKIHLCATLKLVYDFIVLHDVKG